LTPNPSLPEGLATDVAEYVFALSVKITNALPTDSPELTAGLRKLLEAKDCFVRAALDSEADR
jgi:hypothetical protein